MSSSKPRNKYRRLTEVEFERIDKVDYEYVKCNLCKAIECKVIAGVERRKINSPYQHNKHKIKRTYDLPPSWVRIGNDLFCGKCSHEVDKLAAYRQKCEDLQKRHLEIMKERAKRYEN